MRRAGARLLVLVVLLGAAAAHGGEPASLAGQLLVAGEQMGDPRFVRTVIFIVEHDAKGTLGVILNRPVARVASQDLLRDLGRSGEGARGTILVHFGGPVAGQRGFVLHSEEWTGKDSRVIGAGVAFTASTATIEAIARGKGPRRALFAPGYAGWAPRQLEAELAAHAWVTVSPDEALVFDEDPDTKWERAMARRRITL